jgi:hypothetical protein
LQGGFGRPFFSIGGMKMRETWYKLEDGRIVNPAEVSTREDGRLIHESGVLVAMRGDVPFTWGVDPAEQAPANKESITADKPKRGYNRRDVKAV